MAEDPSFPAAHRTWAEIDLQALGHNFDVAQERAGAGVKVMAVVKANAYGHGAGRVVQSLAGRPAMFGVANLAEAREVAAWVAPGLIFILGPALPQERAAIALEGYVPSVSSLEEARDFSAHATQPMAIHLVIDTGMGRIGAWPQEALEVARAISALPRLVIGGLATHLPVADEDESFTHAQLKAFHQLVSALRPSLAKGASVHVANSAGLLGFPAEVGDLVRPGLMLYGSAPLAAWQPQLRPVLTWKTRISLVRDYPGYHGVSYGRTFRTPSKGLRVATLAVGYADGYQRHLSGREAAVLLRGRRCPVLGRVTMDQIMVDVSEVGDAAAGDEVVLLGSQGNEQIAAAELAERAGTIAWEIFTGIGRRVERVYL